MISSGTPSKRRNLLLYPLLPIALIVLPVIVILWYVRSFAVSVPFADEWEFWWSMKGFDEGNWNFAFWIPHNEHRLVVTRIFYFLLRYTSSLDITIAMYFNVLLASLTLWGLWLHLRSSVRVSLWYLVPVAFVVFSLEQWENILWGWQIAIYSMVCSSVWSLYWLSRPGNRNLSLSILAAIVASFSFANGLMIWPTGLIYLILARGNRHRLLIWCGAAVATFLLYFHNYITQVTRPSPTALVRPTSIGEFLAAPIGLLTTDPFSLPAMILGNVGAFLAPQSLNWARLYGAGIVAIYLVCLALLFAARSQWQHKPLSLVALALLSFISSLTIIAGRMGYWDKEFVLTSRYTTITQLGLMATYLLTVAIANGPVTSQPRALNTRYIGGSLCTILCIAMLLGLPGGYQLGLTKGAAQKEERTWQREIVQHFEAHSDEELSRVYGKALRERLLYWKSHKLEPFAH